MGLLAWVLAAVSDFYVAPNGAPGNSGTLASPWDLQTALNQPAAVRPGDTIWLRGGTYFGGYRSWLTGSSSAPIVVRAYPGERPVLDGNHAGAKSLGTVLAVYGAHAWFWGFEVTSSELNPPRNDSSPNSPQGVTIYESSHIKLINLVVHDLPARASHGGRRTRTRRSTAAWSSSTASTTWTTASTCRTAPGSRRWRTTSSCSRPATACTPTARPRPTSTTSI